MKYRLFVLILAISVFAAIPMRADDFSPTAVTIGAGYLNTRQQWKGSSAAELVGISCIDGFLGMYFDGLFIDLAYSVPLVVSIDGSAQNRTDWRSHIMFDALVGYAWRPYITDTLRGHAGGGFHYQFMGFGPDFSKSPHQEFSGGQLLGLGVEIGLEAIIDKRMSAVLLGLGAIDFVDIANFNSSYSYVPLNISWSIIGALRFNL